MSQPDPRQHDEKTFALIMEKATAQRQVMLAANRVHGAAGDTRDRHAEWIMTLSEAMERVSQARKDEYLAAVTECTRICREIDALDAIYGRYLWNRYFLVTNANGHVHRNQSCSSCYPSTEYAWLPELSGCVEAEMITEFGEKACTVCFPDAPANPAFRGPGRRDREAQAARAAEKAAHQAAKDAKNLAPGQCFRDHMNWKVTTVSAAVKVLRDEIEAKYWYPNGYAEGHYTAAARRAAEVLLEREAAVPGTGATQEKIDQVIAAAEKKNAREFARAQTAGIR